MRVEKYYWLHKSQILTVYSKAFRLYNQLLIRPIFTGHNNDVSVLGRFQVWGSVRFKEESVVEICVAMRCPL